jgi:hypothetical protein
MVREAAYFQWLNGGANHGDDWAHWLNAESQIVAGGDVRQQVDPNSTTSKNSLQATLAEHSSDPAHRYHGQGVAHDNRTDIIASGPRQRVRGRHFGGSLRPSQK